MARCALASLRADAETLVYMRYISNTEIGENDREQLLMGKKCQAKKCIELSL